MPKVIRRLIEIIKTYESNPQRDVVSASNMPRTGHKDLHVKAVL
jgi:hypothetical protein